ncbi:MAG: hypothetical protein N2491_10295 [Negativicutes bacterium]|nr:hypothetical protein [Negativicutes bacterium]
MFWSIRFIVFWGVWLIWADKSRWREIVPVCIFACLLGSLTDTLVHYYPLWFYEASLWVEWNDDLSVYPVVVYLFIQWLPQDRKLSNMLLYWFCWTLLAIAIEWVHLRLGYMSYPTGEWNLLLSYIADWLLFTIFYKYHQIFNGGLGAPAFVKQPLNRQF